MTADESILKEIVGKKIVVFGTGNLAVKLGKVWPALAASYYVDNDSAKWNSRFNSKEILNPSVLDKENKDNLSIIIASMYYHEISSQLRSMDFIENEHFFSVHVISAEMGLGPTFEPGHYHSPIPSIKEIRRRRHALFDRSYRPLPGIELNEQGQLKLLHSFKSYYDDLPYLGDQPTPAHRYHFGNQYFEHSDAITLYSMIRHLAPKRIVEVGSGFSSAVMIDTNEWFFNHSIACTFIEPNPERFLSLLKEQDHHKLRLIRENLQDVGLDVFSQLESGDILFIDSSHVTKIGSDVNRLLFDILPSLQDGVYIHIHDMFYPFEYPEYWMYEGKFWNEAYILRAFLQYNSEFQIKFWNHFLITAYPEIFRESMPLCFENTGGSLWIQKVGKGNANG